RILIIAIADMLFNLGIGAIATLLLALAGCASAPIVAPPQIVTVTKVQCVPAVGLATCAGRVGRLQRTDCRSSALERQGETMSKAIRWTEDQLSVWNAGRKQALEAIKPKPSKKTVKPRATSKGELLLDAQFRSVGMAFIPQYKPIPGRKFAFDYFVSPDLLIEVQGGVYAKGNSGHTSGTGITRDC